MISRASEKQQEILTEIVGLVIFKGLDLDSAFERAIEEGVYDQLFEILEMLHNNLRGWFDD